MILNPRLIAWKKLILLKISTFPNLGGVVHKSLVLYRFWLNSPELQKDDILQRQERNDEHNIFSRFSHQYFFNVYVNITVETVYDR